MKKQRDFLFGGLRPFMLQDKYNSIAFTMIRALNKQDLPDIYRLYRICFGTDEDYLNLFFYKNYSRRTFVYEENGSIVSALNTMGISYISSERENNHRKSYPGLYVYGLATLPSCRNKGYATALLNELKTSSSYLGWSFLILRPADTKLISYYKTRGFSESIYRSNYLPSFECGAYITDMNGKQLFLLRDEKLKTNYFQWSHISLDYIIKESIINPPDPLEIHNPLLPYTLLMPLKKNFKLDNHKAIFSFPME